MAPRWPIVVGIVAITGGIAWFELRRGPSVEATKPPDTAAKVPATRGSAHGSTDLTTAAPVPPTLTVPALPALPDGVSSADQVFVTQVRDDDWAPATEAQIKKRFARVRGARLQEFECRQDQCRITVAGSEDEVSRTIADLESDRGLHGFAKNILLTAPDRAADGSMVLKLYAMFER